MNIKKYGLLMVLMTISTVILGQNKVNLEGTWVKENYDEKGIVFNPDSTVQFLESGYLATKELKIKYNIVSKGSISYLVFTISKDNKILKSDTSKYKIENGKLLLPIKRENMQKGQVQVEDFKDVYIKEINNPLIGEWKKTKAISSNGNKVVSDKEVIVQFSTNGKQYVFINGKLTNAATQTYIVKGDTVITTLEFRIGENIISNNETIYYEITNDILTYKLSDGTITYYKKFINKE